MKYGCLHSFGPVLATALVLASSGLAQSSGSCTATYAVQSSWPGNFEAAITINNTGTTAIGSWTLSWTYGGNQQITQLWNGTETQTGETVTVSNLSYNGAIPAGGSYGGVGFNGTVTGTNAVPAISCNTGAITQPPSFTLSASPTSVTVNQGGSGTSTVTITPAGGFTGAVAFTASGLPSGVTASFAPTSTTGPSSKLTLTASATATLGQSSVTITGTSGTLTAAVPISLTVAPPPGFTLSASPTSLVLAPGASGTDTITVTDTGGFTGAVTLAASGLPAGWTAVFAPNPTTSTSVLTLTAPATVAAGTSMVTITGTSGTLTATTTIALTVTGGSFTLTPSAAALSVNQNGSGTDTITVTDAGGFTGSVTLAASGLPSGVTAVFVPNPTTSTSVLTLTASATAAAGTSTVTITGTSGALTATTAITLTVNGGSFTLAPSAATLSVNQNASVTDTITLTDVSPFAGSVTLAASGLPSGVTAVFAPNPTSATSVLTLTASSAAATGLFTVTITGTSGTLTATTTIALTVVGVTPKSSCAIAYTITPQSSNAFGAAITIENTGTTALTSWTLTWTFANGQTIQSLWNGIETQSGANVTVSNESYNGAIPAGGSYNGMGFNGNWNGVANAAPTAFFLNGTSCTVAPPAGFTLAPAPPTLSVTQGSTATDTIKVTDVSGFTGSVTLAASGLPSGVTAAFAPNPTTGTSVLTLTASSTATTGPATVTITGTSGTVIATTTIALTVLPSAGFTLAPSASTLALTAGSSATDTITITDTGGFTGAVTLAVSALPTGVTAVLGTNPATSSSLLTLTATSAVTTQAVTVTITGTSGTLTPVTTTITVTIGAGLTTFQQHFVDLYNDIHTSSNGYFGTATSGDKIPYHSVETLMAEAPDYGHETSSETYSYWIWLETLYGGLTANWTGLQTAWTSMQDNMIPSATLQPTNSGYNAASPATYAPEHPLPSAYPSILTSSVSVGNDPLASQLSSTYGNANMYSMHWIIDTDNFYGFGQQEDGVTKPSCMNTFQRGANESVWLTVPQPCWDALKYGSATNGYLDLFTAPSPYTAQWKYTDAPDADARTVQAMYWAEQYANAQGGSSIVTGLLPKAAELGDYLRYAMFDKYFKAIGCTGASASATSCPAGSGYSSAHYLLGWYFAWGGAIPSAGSWAWRIGDGSTHFGYQNPVAAYALSKDAGISGKLPAQSVTDWSTSLERQLELYRWLQSDEGAIAGGATNSWEGSYSPTPTGDSTFYNMAYDWEPVYHNPPSNQWFGMQAWSMERLAEYYYITGDSKAAIVLNSWIPWVEKVTTVNSNGTFTLPGSLCWDNSPGQGDTTNPWNDSTCGLVTSGTANQPATTWNASTQDWTTVPLNPNLHVRVTGTATDIGLAGSLAKALSYYSAAVGKWVSSGTPDATSEALAKSLLSGVWTNYRDSIGISVAETRSDYCTSTTSSSTNGSTSLNGGFGATVFVPSAWVPGAMPAGEDVTVSPQPTFLSLRPKYENDPNFPLVQAGCSGTAAGPTFNYHRFWAQVDIASAYLVFANLFPGN